MARLHILFVFPRNTARVIIGITYDIRSVESTNDEVSSMKPNHKWWKSELARIARDDCEQIYKAHLSVRKPRLTLDQYLPNPLRAVLLLYLAPYYLASDLIFSEVHPPLGALVRRRGQTPICVGRRGPDRHLQAI